MASKKFQPLNIWRLAENEDFEKKHWNACGFVLEFLRSGQRYRPGERLKGRG